MRWLLKMRDSTYFLLCSLCFFVLLSSTAIGEEATGFGRYYALVIGNKDYKHLDDLKTPLNDAKEVAKVLKGQYGFDDVDLKLNASRREIMDSILDWCDGGILQKNDNLLIYYAGHGRLDSQGKFGYWQPVDARDRETDWVSTFWVTGKLKGAKGKHVLVVADSCYAGSLLTRGNRIPLFDGVNRGEWLYRMYVGRSRTALTSGGKNERVQDSGGDGHSIFAQAFLEVLRKNKEILDGNRLFDKLKTTVVDVALQTPRYNYIPGTGENSGDFLLVPWELRKNVLLPAGRNGLTAEMFRGTSPVIQPVGADFMAIKNVRIRRQPQFISQQVGMLKKGNTVWVVGEVKEQPWYLVDYGEGQQYQGYVYSSSLRKSHEVVEVSAAELVSAGQMELPVEPEEKAKDSLVVIDQPKTKLVVTDTGQRGDVLLVQLVVSKPQQGKPFTDPTTGMEFVSIPKGCFQMGSPPDEEGRDNDEGPVHEVCVDGFWMGKYEVTQGEWQRIMGDNPARFQKDDNYPVERVSWEDAQKFIVELNKKFGKKYRLSTEAEWEYAARVKTSYKYSGGDDLDAVAWYEGNSVNTTQPVGQKQANTFGLYDMSGNVWEWCADWYDEKYYASSPKKNPTGPRPRMRRVFRGGGYFSDPISCRVVNRNDTPPGYSHDFIGFRLVLPFQAAGS